MRQSETLTQETLSQRLRNLINAELKREMVIEKISPIRKIPPKDLTQDLAWIDGKVKWAKRIQTIALLATGVFVCAILYAVFTKDEVTASPAIVLAMCMFFFSAATLAERSRKQELLMKLLRELQ